MPTEIDSLQIEINAKASRANDAIDRLVSKLDRLTISLGRVNGNSLNALSNGIQRLGTSMQTMNSVKTADFTRLATNLTKLNSIDASKLSNLAVNVNHIATSFKGLTGLTESSKQMAELAKGISQLGYKSAEKAITNIPQLATAMRQLMTELSKAPNISKSVIDMTNALAKLARTGASSGKAAESLGKSFKNMGENFLKSSNLFEKINNSMSNVAFKIGNFKNIIVSLLGSFGGIYAIFNGIKNSIDISSDLTEVQNVVNVTFGNMVSKVEEFAQTSIQQFGMSELTLKKVSSQFQAMGSAINISGESILKANKYLNEQTKGYVGISDSLADVSLNLTKLTADMASFYNLEQDVVAEDLRAVFTGMTQPLRQYGIDLTQATLKEWAMKQGLDANVESMTQAEKVMLRYQYVLAHTGAAQGDFARTADTWSNQIRILKQNFQQLASIIGGVFINALKPLIKWLNNAMSVVISFAKTISNALGKIFGWKFEESGGGVATDLGEGAGNAEDIASGIGEAADNAKKLKQQLQGFDELNVLTTDTASGKAESGGSGVGTGGGVSGSDWVKQDSILKEFESEIDSLYELGEYIRDALIGAMESIDWESVYEKARGFGKGLAEFLNGLLAYDGEGRTLFGEVGKTLANTLNAVVYSALEFAKEFDFKQLGTNIADGINKFFENFDFLALADAIDTFSNGFLDLMLTTLKKVRWTKIGNKIGTFLARINWTRILRKTGEMIWKAINAGVKTYVSVFSAAPIETAILTAVSLLKFTKLGSIVSQAITSVLSTPGAIIAKVAIGISTVLIGIDNANIEKSIIEFEEEQIEKYGKTLQVIYDSAAQSSYEISNFNQKTREQLELKDENISYLETLADKYEVLTEKTSLTEDEQSELKSVTEALIDGLPDLQEYYNIETGLLDTTTESIKAMIAEKEKEVKLNAISEAWSETLKQQIEQEKNLKTSVEQLEVAEEELDAIMKIVNDEMKKQGDNANLSNYHEEVSKAMQAVEDLSATVQTNIDTLNSIDEQVDYYDALWSDVASSSSKFEESSKEIGTSVANGVASGITENQEITKEAVQGLVDNLNEKVKEYDKTMFGTTGEEIVNGIAEPLNSCDMSEPAMSIFEEVNEKIREKFGIHSPAETMKPIGEYILMGIVEGFTSAFEFFTTAITEFWNTSVAPWFTIEKWTETMTNILTSLKSVWNSLVSWWNSSAISKWFNSYVKNWFSSSKWNFSGIKQGLSTAWNNAISAIKSIWNNFANWMNDILKFDLDPITIMGKTVYEGGEITLGKLPTYQTGGFPEDGLFMANHNELVGQFSNGRTAVANNEQIVSGIEGGVERAVARVLAPYLSDIAQTNRRIAEKEFGITEREVTNAVVRQSKQYKARTGRPLLA